MKTEAHASSTLFAASGPPPPPPESHESPPSSFPLPDLQTSMGPEEESPTLQALSHHQLKLVVLLNTLKQERFEQADMV